MLAHELREGANRRVSAMGSAERVVDVDVAELRELAREVLVVLLFASVEAQVLEERDLAVAEVVDDLSRAVADAVVREHDLAGWEELRETGADGLERQLGVALALWPPEVRREHDAPTSLERQLDRRQSRPDPRVVGDGGAVERNVEVDAHEDATALDVELLHGANPGHRQPFFAITRARSSMRVENPHSLSYQDWTSTRSPLTTCVSSASTIDECSSPMKSLETSGSSL